MSNAVGAAARRVGALRAQVVDPASSSRQTPQEAPSARVGLVDWFFGASGIGGKRASFTVAVLGAAGGIGQTLSAFIKANPKVAELRLYDVAPVVRGCLSSMTLMEFLNMRPHTAGM